MIATDSVKKKDLIEEVLYWARVITEAGHGNIRFVCEAWNNIDVDAHFREDEE